MISIHKKNMLALGLIILTQVNTYAGIEQLIPKPQYIQKTNKAFSAQTLKIEGLYLQPEMRELLAKHGLKEDASSSFTIRTVIVPTLPKVYFNKDEAYRLTITESGILIEALERTGLYRGLQTLDQLLASRPTNNALEGCEIIDWPSFRMRGIMHDVGRTYIPLPELKKQIAHFARYKINTFHWHLTENQAWRLESKRYPQLTSASSMTRMAGKYYTLEEAKELADYCRSLRITLIPEIDMPGHSAAFERAMGFGMQTEQGKQVLKAVLSEVAEAIDAPYIHIGTDEVEFTDPTFVPEMVAYVRSLGKKAISWNPGWKYKFGEIDMLHLWSSNGKAMLGTPAIDSRLHYINHYDLFADIQMLYSSQILKVKASNTNVMGATLAVWNDRYVPNVDNIMGENSVYPNMMALAERGWLGGGTGYFNDKTAALSFAASDSTRREFINFEERMLWHKDKFFQTEAFPYVKQSHATWYISEVYNNEGDLTKVFKPEKLYMESSNKADFTPPESVNNAKYPYNTGTHGSGAYLRHVWGNTCYGIIPNAQPNSTAYATAWIRSDKEQEAGLLFETQNYSRSEKDLAPAQGTWDYKGSRLWLNGEEIKAPVWTATHTELSNEIPLGNENATARPPLRIKLRKGWNRILIKLPISNFTLPQIRLNKWMFAAAIVTTDGREALSNIEYARPSIAQ